MLPTRPACACNCAPDEALRAPRVLNFGPSQLRAVCLLQISCALRLTKRHEGTDLCCLTACRTFACLLQIDRTVRLTERLRTTSVHNDVFHIWHDGPFGTIGGFRLGAPLNALWGGTRSMQLGGTACSCCTRLRR